MKQARRSFYDILRTCGTGGSRMHGYSIDSDERRNVVFGLAILGIAAAYCLDQLLDLTSASLPWWFDAPASFGFFGLFYWLFDQRVWRWRMLRTLGLVTAPDLSGHWKGSIVSSHVPRDRHEVTVDIRQSWTGLTVVLTGASSRSYSTAAVLRTKAADGPELTHTYRNEPLPHATDTMHIHHGTATMRLAEAGQQLVGEYYTGRGRQTYGSITLRRLHVVAGIRRPGGAS